VTPERCVILAAALFAIGAYGVVARRNLLVVLMSIEIMFNAANLALVAMARVHTAAGGHGAHVFVLVVMAVAAAEVAVGLALALALFRRGRTVDTAVFRMLRG
jgi:NADH-quinone oxidoreductase subunit K